MLLSTGTTTIAATMPHVITPMALRHVLPMPVVHFNSLSRLAIVGDYALFRAIFPRDIFQSHTRDL